MAKKQEWTRVSQLVGRTTFSVSGGGKNVDNPKYVPLTDGFTIEVTYDNDYQVMADALTTKVIQVQNTLRTFYIANKRFPFAPGKMQKVDGEGKFTLPVASQVDRLEAQAAQGLVSTADLIRIAKAAGMAIPQEWLDQVVAEPTASDDEDGQGNNGDNDDGMKYPAGSLEKIVISKLKRLAQDEELEGYDELTAEELREELYAIEKE